jgi:hypothetical protein
MIMRSMPATVLLKDIVEALEMDDEFASFLDPIRVRWPPSPATF